MITNTRRIFEWQFTQCKTVRVLLESCPRRIEPSRIIEEKS